MSSLSLILMGGRQDAQGVRPFQFVESHFPFLQGRARVLGSGGPRGWEVIGTEMLLVGFAP